MISESLKTNNTLTTLDLRGDENEVNEQTNKQTTRRRKKAKKWIKNKEDKKKGIKKEERRKKKEREKRRRKMINNEIWTGNDIGAEGARMIIESLKTNTTLTKLDLSGEENEINEKK